MATLTLSETRKVKKKEPSNFQEPINMKTVASVILSGGEGTRLYPLTLTRSKPAISFGGKYRLIDVPISNSIHAECNKIFVITQFLSSSLHHHIFQTYLQNTKSAGLIEILTAEQKPSQKTWFQGTADAVRQNLDYLLEHPFEYFLILSGDQLYNMDFEKMVRFAKKTDADVVIAALPVTAQEAPRLGILKIDANDFIIDFQEKPQDRTVLNNLKSPAEVLERAGVHCASKRCYLGSMGIYLFKRKSLIDLLAQDPREDFGKHLIPTKLQTGNVAAFLFDDYWEDVGSIETFYQANMALTDVKPAFNLRNEERPIYGYKYDLPPAKIMSTQLNQAILCDGAFIEADEISHSILGPRTIIEKGSIIRDSYIMGNDYYHSEVEDNNRLPNRPHIGENCIIKRTIIDKNVSIGKGVQLINKQKLTHFNGENIFIRDGIIVVPRGVTLPDGFIL